MVGHSRNTFLLFLGMTLTVLTVYMSIISQWSPRSIAPRSTQARNIYLSCAQFESVDPEPTQNITSLNQTTTAAPSGSHLLIPNNGKDAVQNKSMVGTLWNFKEVGDQLLFLYERLLQKNWTPNITNSETLRQDFARFRPELSNSSMVIIHQGNVVLNQTLRHAYSRAKFKFTQEMMDLMPKADPIGLKPGKRFGTCAVIGNSGSVLNSHCGERIDKNDFVIRCNLAPLPPFKEDAGLKSNITTMNPSMIRQKKYGNLVKEDKLAQFHQDISNYGGMIALPCFAGLGGWTALHIINVTRGKDPPLVCLDSRHYQAVIDFWKKTGAFRKRLSTGFYMVSMAIQLCDRVELYGFWPFSLRYDSDQRTSVKYHYFDRMKASVANKMHAMNDEFSVLVQLHNSGVVNLKLGSCVT